MTAKLWQTAMHQLEQLQLFVTEHRGQNLQASDVAALRDCILRLKDVQELPMAEWQLLIHSSKASSRSTLLHPHDEHQPYSLSTLHKLPQLRLKRCLRRYPRGWEQHAANPSPIQREWDLCLWRLSCWPISQPRQQSCSCGSQTTWAAASGSSCRSQGCSSNCR